MINSGSSALETSAGLATMSEGSHCWRAATRVIGKSGREGMDPLRASATGLSAMPQQQFPMSTQDIADTALEGLHASLLSVLECYEAGSCSE